MRECVAALVVKEGMILLGQRSGQRSFYPQVWDVFGGHVEPGEAREQALQRELAEELGITPIRWEYLLTAVEPEPERDGPGRYYFYRVTAWEGDPQNRQPLEHAQIRWFALDHAVRLNLAHSAYVDLFGRFVSTGPDTEREPDDHASRFAE
jgi:8-oxo-dGTP diphosphatase